MLSPADAAVVARDAAVPGLALLLDDDAVSERLGAPVRRDYLRYKPGTSCVLGGRIDLPAGPADLFVTAYDAEGAVKIDKTVADAPRGSVLHVDRIRGLVAALSSADRDLPALAALSGERTRRKALRRLLPNHPGTSSAVVSTLSYKPMRRWVGLLTSTRGPSVVLRAYRPQEAGRAAAVVRDLAAAAPRTPHLLGVDEELGILAVEYLEGQTLHALLARGEASAAHLAEVGRALAQLHSSGRLVELPARAIADDTEAARAAAAQVGVLLPELAAEAGRLAEELSRRLARVPREHAVVHGDFSADQVVVGPDGAISLLDLDRAVNGDPAADLASLSAAAAAEGATVTGTPADVPSHEVAPPLQAGYASVRPLPAEEAVRTHVAALLLRRVVEPFRLCLPDWPDRSRLLLGQAVAAVPGPLETGCEDLLQPLLGGGRVSWEVLKDKPGRRRTSRATGPSGTAIVKVYASGRAPVVAGRVRALADGPAEPTLPRVLLCDEPRHVVVLSEVPGRPFREAVLGGDVRAASRVGRSLATWHAAHRGRVPAGLRPHTAGREIEILRERCATALPAVRALVLDALPGLQAGWVTDTVVHRDLYEEQIVLDEAVGLLDLDDAAAGPAELDLGNLSAHLELLGRRTGTDVDVVHTALLDAYAAHAPLDTDLLARCRRLSLLRLACLHADPSLVPSPDADERTLISGSRLVHGRAAG